MDDIVKPIHVKPSFYAYCFEHIKEIGLNYGYNIVLHGSLNRDLDLIAIPWVEEIGDCAEMINEIAEFVGGTVIDEIVQKPHNRKAYAINIYRGGYEKIETFQEWGYKKDPQYYIDISVI